MCIPIRLHCFHPLTHNNYASRVKFCQWFLQPIGNNHIDSLIYNIDEAPFSYDGIIDFFYMAYFLTIASINFGLAFWLVSLATALSYHIPNGIARTPSHMFHAWWCRRFCEVGFSNDTYPNIWVKRKAPVSYPPCFSDRSPLDYYLYCNHDNLHLRSQYIWSERKPNPWCCYIS